MEIRVAASPDELGNDDLRRTSFLRVLNIWCGALLSPLLFCCWGFLAVFPLMNHVVVWFSDSISLIN